MRVTEPQLRTLLLAQAIDQADTRHTLVSPVELQDATRSAVAAARARGLPRVGVAEVMLERATTIADHASGRDSTVAALHAPHAPHTQRPGAGGLRPWVARVLPLAALLLGLAIDRISNAHRVDLLSPPLLTVLAWNLTVFLLIAWRAWRPPSQPSAWLQQALRPLSYPFGRAERGRGLAARIAADFHQRWWAHAADLLQQRAARVLHLCAAAWGAGIALSLLLRGLVVRYQFGWESTFLDATQVHAIVSVLFAPLTLLLGLAPFTLQEIAATQNFAGESGVAGAGGAAGSRWVGMYVGLLLLAVVLPRLALAAWARWREHRWQGHIDPQGPAFDALRASLPGDLVIGLHGPQAQAQVLLGASLQTPQGDRLQWVADASAPVDAVLAWTADPLPPAWQAAPRAALRWEDFGASWVLEPTLFDRLGAALPAPPCPRPPARRLGGAQRAAFWPGPAGAGAAPARLRRTHPPATGRRRRTLCRAGARAGRHAARPAWRARHASPPPGASGTPGPAAHRTTPPRWHGPGPGHLGRGRSGRCRRGQGGRADRPGHRRPDPGRRHGPGRAAGRHHGLGGAIAAKEGRRAAGPAATRR